MLKKTLLVLSFFLLASINLVEAKSFSKLGDFYQENQIIIETQTYIDSYVNWVFKEINSTHWFANFTFNTTFLQDAKNVFNKPCSHKDWSSFQQKYFPEYDATKVCNDVKNLTDYPYQELTGNIKIQKLSFDLNNGFASFYLIFPSGFKPNEKAKFGFNSTIINTALTVPFYPNQRAICRDEKNYIHVVWLYNSTQVRYARSLDNGLTWQVNTSFYTATSVSTPHISCNGNNITVSFASFSGAIITISTDNGNTWSWKAPRTSCVQDFVIAERRGSRIYVVYQTPATSPCGWGDIRFFNSSDGGDTWSSDQIIFDGSKTIIGYAHYYEPSLFVNGNGSPSDFLHIVAYETDVDAQTGISNNYIVYNSSSNSGSTWSGKYLILSSTIGFSKPSITGNSSGGVFVAYSDTANIILINVSYNNGSTFTGYQLDLDDNKTAYPSVALNNLGLPVVFWQQNNTALNLRYNIVYRNFTGSTWSGLIWLTNNNNNNMYPNAKPDFSGNCIELVYMNGTASPYNIVYQSIGSCSAPSLPDNQAPQYSLNSTNSTLAGSMVMHSLFWQDNFGLSQAIFYFDNCTGNLQPVASMTLSGTQAWSNFTVKINSTVGCLIRWCVNASDISGNWNFSSCLNPFSYITTGMVSYERIAYFTTALSIQQSKQFLLEKSFYQTIKPSFQITKLAPLTKSFLDLFVMLGLFEDRGSYYCKDNTTLVRNTTFIFCENDRCNIYSKSEEINCTWGCDYSTNSCAPNPFYKYAIVVAVIVVIIIIVYLIRRRYYYY